VFDAADDDGVLIDHLARLTGRPVTADDLARWRAEQREDSAHFRAYLTALRPKPARADPSDRHRS
jgi:hypothetical protein